MQSATTAVPLVDLSCNNCALSQRVKPDNKVCPDIKHCNTIYKSTIGGLPQPEATYHLLSTLSEAKALDTWKVRASRWVNKHKDNRC